MVRGELSSTVSDVAGSVPVTVWGGDLSPRATAIPLSKPVGRLWVRVILCPLSRRSHTAASRGSAASERVAHALQVRSAALQPPGVSHAYTWVLGPARRSLETAAAVLGWIW